MTLKVFAGVCFLISIFCFNLTPENFRYLIFFPVLQYIYLITKSKPNKPIVILFIYAIIFHLYLIPKFVFDIDIVFYEYYDDIRLYNKALLINIVFICSFTFFYQPVKKHFQFPDYQDFFNPNKIIVFINIFIMLLIFFFGFSGNNLLDNATYGSEDFGNKTIYTEYFIIFLAIAIFHSNTKRMKYFIIFLAILMALKGILYGSRISSLLIFLTLFILLYPNKFSLRKLILWSFLGIFLMNFIGILRKGIINLDIKEILRIAPNDVMVSTQSNMFYGSVSFLGLIEDNVIDFDTRLRSLIGFIGRIFLPSDLSFPEGSLTTFAVEYVDFGGGAHPATYFYVWFGWAGPFIFGAFLAKTFNKLNRDFFSKYFYFFIIIILSTFPRWYGYEPGILFKMTWVGIVIYIFLKYLFPNRLIYIESKS